FIFMNEVRKHRIAHILAEGKLVKCWIVMCEDVLHRGIPAELRRTVSPDFSANAQVVFTPVDNVPNLDQTLARIAEAMRSFQVSANPPKEERSIAWIMRTKLSYFNLVRVPERLTDGLEAYTVTLRVYWSKLPGTRLERPYVYCKVILDEGVEMV